MKPMYGLGYEPLGDLADFVDPFGLRKIPGKVRQKVDNYVEGKAQRAATLAEQHVEAGARRAVGDAGKTALAVAAGGALTGVVVAGIYFYRRAKAQESEP